MLKQEIAVMVADATEKQEVSAGIAVRVKAEKEVVDMETDNAIQEEAKVTQIQIEVSEKQH